MVSNAKRGANGAPKSGRPMKSRAARATSSVSVIKLDTVSRSEIRRKAPKPPTGGRVKKHASGGPKFISLFSGAGGLDIGLEQAGFDCVFATDNDPVALATLHANKGKSIARGRTALANTALRLSDVRSLDEWVPAGQPSAVPA